MTAVGQSFGPGVDYAQMVKNYGSGRRPDHRYEPSGNAPFITKRAVFGAPNMAQTSTAYMERNNATMRHHIGRMRRLCYAFSKKLAHHKAAVALGYVHYRLCSVVSTLRVSPAVATGVVQNIWDIDMLLDALLSEAPCERPEKQPLKARTPDTACRPLPEGRGFLRVVPGGAAKATAPAPVSVKPAPVSVKPAPVPVVTQVEVAPVVAAEPAGQLDLLTYLHGAPGTANSYGCSDGAHMGTIRVIPMFDKIAYYGPQTSRTHAATV